MEILRQFIYRNRAVFVRVAVCLGALAVLLLLMVLEVIK